MAIFLPSLADLISTSQRRNKPNEFESKVLTYLNENLDDSYDVYFRPFLNGFTPSIIIFKEFCGLIVLDIFNCKRDELGILPKKYFESFSDELISIVSDPDDKNFDKSKVLSSIHGACIVEKNCRFVQTLLNDSNSISFSTYSDEYFFNKKTLISFLSHYNMIYPALVYDIEIFKEIKRNLKPSIHYIEEGRLFSPNKKQNALIVSTPGDCRIKGVAGTGKTTVIAHRAVNANARTNNQVLILTFNITIRHYIRYKLEGVMRKYYRSDFHISHYHDFFKHQSIQHLRKLPKIGDWENEDYFANAEIPKYDTIIVDEAQDYKRLWVVILKKYFLKPNGEFVISFDENQDIFQVKQTTSFPIIGRPNELSTSYRLSNDISSLTQKFYTKFLSSGEPFLIEKDNLRLNFNDFKESLDYVYFNKDVSPEILYNYIDNQIKSTKSNPDDIAVIGISIDQIRELEYCFRFKKRQKTTRMFESKEQFEDIKNKYSSSEKSYKLNQELKALRRKYKLKEFDLVTGAIKFSSVHSFKGWEIRTLFFIISESSDEVSDLDHRNSDSFITPELVYTGLTRARNNLFIINLGQLKYHDFFLEHLL